MAIAHSTATESHTGTTAWTTGPYSWTHTEAGAPDGVVVFVVTFATSITSSVSLTYGGVSIPRRYTTLPDAGLVATDTAGEPGRVEVFFRGSGLPSGNQTINATRSSNGNNIWMCAITVTADVNSRIEESTDLIQGGDGTLTEQSIDDLSPGTNSLRYAGAYSGLATPPVAGANSTLLHSIDIGQFGAAVVRETTAGQGSRPVGFSAASDDRAALYFAICDSLGIIANRTTYALTQQTATLTKTTASTFTLTANITTYAYNTTTATLLLFQRRRNVLIF